jgi:magnesium/cobalt transport protein CorA
MATALLYERDAVDEIADWTEGVPRLGRSSVLWIDLEQPDEAEVERLAELLDLGRVNASELIEHKEPRLRDHESYLEVTALAPTDGERSDLTALTCLVAERWIVTIHERPLEILETFRERTSGSGETGRLDGPEFLAHALEWVLSSYFDAFETIDLALEELDTTTMTGQVDRKDEALRRLVEIRRDIGNLRRGLTAHRELTMALARPELDAITSSKSAGRFAELCGRLEDAVQAARDCRESVVGSFDVLIASTGQRTNEIMKVLTLASVLILPGTLLAGIMGMNFKLGLFEQAAYFWAVLVAMLAVAFVTLAVARVRHWI